MKASIGAFPAKTEGLGAQVLAPTVLADGTKQFDLTATVDPVGGLARQDGRGVTYNGTVPGPTIKVDPGDNVRDRAAQRAARVDLDPLPRPDHAELDGRHDRRHPGPGEDRARRSPTSSTAQDPRRRHVPLAPRRGEAGARRPRRRASIVGDEPVPAGVDREPGAGDDPRRLGHHRLRAQRQVVPGHRAHRRQAGRVGRGPLHERGHADPSDAPARHAAAGHRQGRLPAGARRQPEDTVTVAPGERYTVLVHATEPGTWVWHCHILPHAENEHGMFGMVTALVVQ